MVAQCVSFGGEQDPSDIRNLHDNARIDEAAQNYQGVSSCDD